MRKLIDERKTKWSPGLVRDPVQERLAEIIGEKKKGLPPRKKTEEGETAAPPSNVVNIMEALRRSVASAPGPAKPRGRRR